MFSRKRLTILGLALLSVVPVGSWAQQSPAPAPNPVTAEEAALWEKGDLARHACKVFKTNCAKCHSPGNPADIYMRDVLDPKYLVTAKKVFCEPVAELDPTKRHCDPKLSLIHQRITRQEMPPDQ